MDNFKCLTAKLTLLKPLRFRVFEGVIPLAWRQKLENLNGFLRFMPHSTHKKFRCPMPSSFQKQLLAQAKKKSAMLRLSSLSSNDIAKVIGSGKSGFLQSPEWKTLRAKVIDHYGGKCMCCGVTPKHANQINVDHIKPRKLFPELALSFDNLQVLCGKCNKAKGNKHQTDYR